MDISTRTYPHNKYQNLFPLYLKSTLHPEYSVQATPAPVIVARSSKCPVSTKPVCQYFVPCALLIWLPPPAPYTPNLCMNIYKREGWLHEKDVPSCCLLPVSTPPSYILATYLPFARTLPLAGWQGVCGKGI
jgi:hypothetical protein